MTAASDWACAVGRAGDPPVEPVRGAEVDAQITSGRWRDSVAGSMSDPDATMNAARKPDRVRVALGVKDEGMSDVRAACSHLLDVVEAAAGASSGLTINVGSRRIIFTRLGLFEALLGDEEPTCGDMEDWVVTTARTLGSDGTRARVEPSGPETLRISMVVAMGDLDFVVEAFSSLPDTPGDELAAARIRRNYEAHLSRSGRG